MVDLSNLPKRICPLCPEMTFADIKQHTDHLQSHEPTPEQWNEAYHKIQQGREKERTKDRARQTS